MNVPKSNYQPEVQSINLEVTFCKCVEGKSSSFLCGGARALLRSIKLKKLVTTSALLVLLAFPIILFLINIFF